MGDVRLVFWCCGCIVVCVVYVGLCVWVVYVGLCMLGCVCWVVYVGLCMLGCVCGVWCGLPSSFTLPSFSFSALFSLVFPLSNDDNDHSSQSALSLSTRL